MLMLDISKAFVAKRSQLTRPNPPLERTGMEGGPPHPSTLLGLV